MHWQFLLCQKKRLKKWNSKRLTKKSNEKNPRLISLCTSLNYNCGQSGGFISIGNKTATVYKYASGTSTNSCYSFSYNSVTLASIAIQPPPPPTATPTRTPTATATATMTATHTRTSTMTYTVTYTPSMTATGTLIPTNTPTNSPTPTATPDPANKITYTYDGDDKLVMSKVGNEVTLYPNAYYEVQGTTIRKYYFAGSQRIAVRQNNELTFLLVDHLGSTVGTVNSSGNLGSRTKYTAFGETRGAATISTDYLYTSQREENEIGLYFYNARWYDPTLARFIQADTVIPQASVYASYDRYGYVNNNPVRYNDPSGHWACDDYYGRGCNIIKDLPTTYLKGYTRGQLVSAHQYQGDNTPNCGPYAAAIGHTLLTGETIPGSDINNYLVNNFLKFKNLGIPGKPLKWGLNLLFFPDNWATYQKNGTLDQLKNNVDEGIITIVGVSWQTNPEIIKALLRREKLTVGHWMVVGGYNDFTEKIILIDPGKNPPFTFYSYAYFQEIWIDNSNLFVGNGDLITIR